jgi:hypothetical protein
MYRDNFNLPFRSVGILDETNPNVRRPELAVFSGDTLVIPGEQVPVGEKVAADGLGGLLVTRDLVLSNPGRAPVTINSATHRRRPHLSHSSTTSPGRCLTRARTVTLTLRFDPQSAGSFADTLTIASDAATSPLFSIQLGADAIPLAPTATLTLGPNNFGGVAVASGTSNLPQLATITNSGFQPLSISRVSLAEGTGAFSFLGLPPDLATNPISLESGESFTFGLAFDPPQPGLQRALVEVGTNDPATPVLNAGAVGTGVGSVVYPDWGDDFVAIRSNSTLRAVSDASGNFEIFLPAQTDYETIIFDPVTGLVTHNFGTTPTSGRGLDLTVGLVFAASTAPDTDFDGLPDDIEFAVGTGIGKNDTDGDGVSDFVEVLRGLDPLGGRSLPTGVVSAVAMAGEAKEVVTAVLANDPVRQLAFVATGTAGLAVADVTDVSKPKLLGQLDLPGDATDVAVDPLLGIAVVTTNTGGLHFVDVGDPTKLNVLRSVSGNASQVEVGGGRAFVTSGSNLRAYDLLSGDLLQSISTGSNTLTGLSVDGTALFTMESGNTLRAFDVSGGTIAPRDTLAMPVGGGKVFVGNGVAYVGGSAFGAGGFASANVADLNALTLLSGPDNTALGGTAFASSGGRFGVAVGHSDFVQGAFRALDVVDISDPANTGNFITRINLPERPLGVVLGSGFAFVADGAAGLQLINFASADAQGVAPVANLAVTSLDIDPATPGVQVQEGTAIRLHPAITEDVQLAKVDLLLNGIVVASDISFPFDVSTLAPAIGSLVGGPNANLQVRATDTGGNTTVSAPAQITLVPDTFPPSLLSQDPPDGARRTEAFRTVTLTFSEPIAASTVTGQAIHLVGPGGEIVPLSIDLRAGNQQARVTYPALAVGNYTFSVDRNEITDTAGNLLGSTTTSSGFEIIRSTIEWVGATSAFWDQAVNWSTGVLPVATDVVYVPPGSTLTHRFRNRHNSGSRRRRHSATQRRHARTLRHGDRKRVVRPRRRHALGRG